ncbi:MAG: cardiolipin synthase [Micropepsaceae bacterium]
MEQLVELVVDIRPEFLYALRLAIAVMVTIHVLLTKREVGSSVAWIGLVWLSPILGGSIYFVFGINRVRRRARTLLSGGETGKRRRLPNPGKLEAAQLRPLMRGIGAITGLHVETGNAVTVFQNGDEAYPAMLAAIAGAKSSIGLSSYIMRADDTGRIFIAALRDAQERGVDVRTIIDGVGSGWLWSPTYTSLRRAGLKAGRFMHSFLPWRMSFVNLRTHRKILLVDGTRAFVGGLNIADENLLAARPKEPVQDTHFEVRGPVVAQIADVFADDWSFLTGEDLEGSAWFAPQAPQGEALARVISAGPDQDLDRIEAAILQAITCARDSIRVMTPYFLPEQQILSALSLAAMRGVKVQIIVPEQGNHRIIDWAIRAHVGQILISGCEVIRSPRPFRHSKLCVVDGEWSLIGSSNWDIRSFRLNFEICVEVYGRELAAKLERQMDESLGRPLDLDELKSASLFVRLRNAAARLFLPYL